MPSPWVGLILAMAAYRLTRLAGWDDFPLAVKIRACVIGQRWVADTPHGTVKLEEFKSLGIDLTESQFPRPAMQEIGRSEDEPVSLPGKQTPSEVQAVRPAYDRPTLAHLLHCPFCASFWIALALYGFWLWQPHWTVVAMMPFVLSGFVGLVSKNLDP